VEFVHLMLSYMLVSVHEVFNFVGGGMAYPALSTIRSYIG
jgi:hypothetical protein